jgi:uncharacterized protein YbjT (DUF2867 family)
MTDRPTSLLVVGATGSIGRHVVDAARRHGLAVRALVRDPARAERILSDVDLVVGDLEKPTSLSAAVRGVDAIVFTHGGNGSPDQARRIDYGGVANVLQALDGRSPRIALMTSIYVARRENPNSSTGQLLDWKRRSERLVRASGAPYTIVRPGWFDYNDADQRRIVMRQGDTAQSGGPADGVIARDEIARVLIESLGADAANRKTFELAAEAGPEQDDLTSTFAALRPDAAGALDGVADTTTVPVDQEPAPFRDDLSRIRQERSGEAS